MLKDTNNLTNNLQIALLLHTCAGQSHYDWLIENPLKPNGRLWTARIQIPSNLWASAGQCDIEIIAPHRRKYLSYEGEISNNRGTVKRVDEGQAICNHWEDDDIFLDIKMKNYLGKAHIYRKKDNSWRAQFGKDIASPIKLGLLEGKIHTDSQFNNTSEQIIRDWEGDYRNKKLYL